MQQNAFGNQQSDGTGRRGGIRWWVIILFAGYAAWQWFGNSEPDPFTGEKAHYGATTDQEAQMGLQAFQQVLNEENPLPDNNPNAIAITAIAKRLVNVASNVEADLAAENNMASPKLAETFQWSVAVLESPQANAFCLPGGKMAVYTGLIPVAQNEDAMAVVMGHEIAHALLRHGSQRMAQQKLVQMGQMAAGVAIGDMDPNQQQMVMSAWVPEHNMGWRYLLAVVMKRRRMKWALCWRLQPATTRNRRFRCGSACRSSMTENVRRNLRRPILIPRIELPICRH